MSCWRPAYRCGLLFAAMNMAAASAASAHDFWAQPERFRNSPESSIAMTLQVGHGKDRQRSRISESRITRFAAIDPTGREIDLRSNLDLGGSTADGTIRLTNPGVYLLVLETDNRAQSHLPADRFNRYLEDEGLTPALELRRRMGRMQTDGAETYSRRAKSIILVGSPDPSQQSQVTRPIGLALEIVPEVSPYDLSSSSLLPVRVFYEGSPLAGALVKLTDLENDAAPIAAQRTDNSGQTTFAIPRAGNWLLNVVWTKPRPPGGDTDFETIFSSLTFAAPKGS